MSNTSGDQIVTAIFSVLLAIVLLAGLAALLSPSAQSGNVISGIGKQFALAIKTALCPIVSPGNCAPLPIGTSSSTITFG